MSKQLQFTLPVGAFIGGLCHRGDGVFTLDLFKTAPATPDSKGLIVFGLDIGNGWPETIYADLVEVTEAASAEGCMTIVKPAIGGEGIKTEPELLAALGVTDEELARYREHADKVRAHAKAQLAVSLALKEAGLSQADLVPAVQLLSKVRAFIEKHGLGCPESLFQRDNPQIDALTVMGDLCELAGWQQDEDADE